MSKGNLSKNIKRHFQGESMIPLDKLVNELVQMFGVKLV